MKPVGEIISAHCLCMAGCGSVCSHVAALLFAVATGIAMRDSVSCTQRTNAWLPAYVEDVPYLPVKELNFMSAKKRKTVLDTISSTADPASKKFVLRSSCKLPLSTVPWPTELEWTNFFKNLNELPDQSAVLRVVPDYCKTTESEARSKLITNPTELFQSANRNLSWSELLCACELELESLQITTDVSQKVELLTRSQSNCKTWYKVGTGKITASVMKNVCTTNVSSPSLSLIKRICYLYNSSFKSAPTEWGCNNEKVAKSGYQVSMASTHVHHKMLNSGFQINPWYPFMGASPDAIIRCDCCGKGVLEVKCPFSYKDRNVLEYSSSKYSCLTIENGKLKLARNHAYYYQVQTQMLVCEVEYSDFVIWTTTDIYIDRVYVDKDFCDEIIGKAKCFYKIGVLPELLAKWYTNPTTNVNTTVLSENCTNVGSFAKQPLFCYCQKPFVKTMVLCNRDDCKLKYFHLVCLKIKNKPRSKVWACPDCRKKKVNA